MSGLPLFDWTAPDVIPPAEYPAGIPPVVCLQFEQLANELREMGLNRYSADAILHRVRWHWQIERKDRGFKCNNNWSAPLARWFLKRNPKAEGFFELREAASEVAA